MTQNTKICFSCCNNKRLSEEHVIPQALGGKLSAWIYCVDCNSQFGTEIDSELIKNIQFFGTALDIKRVRGKNQPHDVTLAKNGTKLTFDGREFKRKKPIVKIEKDGDKIKAAIDKTIATGEGQTLIMKAEGFNEEYESVSKFEYTWSVKVKE